MSKTCPKKQKKIQTWLLENAFRVDHVRGLLLRFDGKARVATVKRGYRYHIIKVNKKFLTVAEHQLVWSKVNGPVPKGLTIDHINRVVDDNRIENLRLADLFEQQQNAPRTKLTRENVYEICSSKESVDVLANKFNISVKYLYIVRGRNKGLKETGDV